MVAPQRASCPKCGAGFKTEGLRADKLLKCPKCSQRFTLAEVLPTGMPAAPLTVRSATATPPPVPRVVPAAQAQESARPGNRPLLISGGIAALAVVAGVVWFVAGPGRSVGRDSAETPGVAGNAAVDPHGTPRITHEQVLAGLPQDKRPKPGPQGLAARQAANAWLKANAAGKPLDVQFVVDDVPILEQPDGKHAANLSVTIDPELDGPASLSDGVWGGDFRVDGIPCYIEYWGEKLLWTGLSDTDAARLRDLKGQKITFRVQTNDVEFQEGDDEKQLKLVITFAKIELPTEPAPSAAPAEVPEPSVASRKRPAEDAPAPAEEPEPSVASRKRPAERAKPAETPLAAARAETTFASSGPAGVLQRPDADSILGVAWSPDGRSLAAFGNAGRATLWDVASARGRDVSPTNDGPEAAGADSFVQTRHVAFSADGKTLVVGTAWKIAVIDVPSGKIRWETGDEFKQGGLIVNHGATRVAVLVPDTERRAYDPTVSVRDVAGGAEVFRSPTIEERAPIALSAGKLAIYDRSKIRLFDVAAKAELAPIPVAGVREMAFSGDGRQLLLPLLESQVWDVSNSARPALVKRTPFRDDGVTGRLRAEGKHLALSADGRVVAGWKPGTDIVELHDAVTGASLITVNSLASAVALDADGGRIALGTGDEIILRSAGQKSRSVLPFATLKLTVPPEIMEQDAFKAPPVRAWFSPDGKWLITGGRAMTVWDLPGRRQHMVLMANDGRAEVTNYPPNSGFNFGKLGFGSAMAVNGWLYHGDGRTLTVASQHQPGYWHYDLQDLKHRNNYNDPLCPGMKSSPDGRFAAAWQHERAKPGTRPEDSPELVILDQSARVKKSLGTFGAPDWARLDAFATLAFSADSRLLAAQVHDRGRQAIKVWEWETGRELPTTADAPIRSLNLIDSSRLLMTMAGDEQATLYDVQTGALRHTLELRLGHAGYVTASAFAPVGSLFATGDANGVLLLRDFTTGAESGRVQSHGKSISAIGFSKDGAQIATCGTDGEIKVWRTSDLTSGR